MNKKIFITGGTGGIGSAICDKFYKDKYTLVLTSSSKDKLEVLKTKYGSNNFYYKINFLDKENIKESTQEISKIIKIYQL